MDSSAVQTFLNSVVGVLVAMAVIAKLMPSWRKNIVALVGIYLLFAVANAALMLDRTPATEAILRALAIALMPMVFGYVWSIVLSKFKRDS